jgi:hypothetical protein
MKHVTNYKLTDYRHTSRAVLIPMSILELSIEKEVKSICVTGRGDLQGCEMLKIPHCLDNRLTDGGNVVRPTQRPRSIPPETLFFCFWYSFLLEDE